MVKIQNQIDFHAFVCSLESKDHFYIGNVIFSTCTYNGHTIFLKMEQYGYLDRRTVISAEAGDIYLSRTAAIKSIEEIDESTYSKAKEIFEMASKRIELLNK